MEQENITFHEYLLTKRGKEVHLSSDLCFKYNISKDECRNNTIPDGTASEQ